MNKGPLPTPFWLVWNEDGHAPRVKQKSQHAAEKEAQRLAEAYPGSSFVVLAPLARFTRSLPIVEERFFVDDDSIPF